MGNYIRTSPIHGGQEVTGGNSVLSMPTSTVAGLPSAAVAGAGARAFVTDASLAFASAQVGTTVAGGGANLTPVYSDGTNWKFG